MERGHWWYFLSFGLLLSSFWLVEASLPDHCPNPFDSSFTELVGTGSPLNCSDPTSNCFVNCPPSGCTAQPITCPSGATCVVNCTGVLSCQAAIINCQPGQDCLIRCAEGLGSCRALTVNCGVGSRCVVDCYSAGEFTSTIECENIIQNCNEASECAFLCPENGAQCGGTTLVGCDTSNCGSVCTELPQDCPTCDPSCNYVDRGSVCPVGVSNTPSPSSSLRPVSVTTKTKTKTRTPSPTPTPTPHPKDNEKDKGDDNDDSSTSSSSSPAFSFCIFVTSFLVSFLFVNSSKC